MKKTVFTIIATFVVVGLFAQFVVGYGELVIGGSKLPSGYITVTEPGIQMDVFQFDLDVSATGSGQLVIKDKGGVVIKTIAKGNFAQYGLYLYVWDQTDDKGEFLKSGKYFVEFEVFGYTSTKKMLILK